MSVKKLKKSEKPAEVKEEKPVNEEFAEETAAEAITEEAEAVTEETAETAETVSAGPDEASQDKEDEETEKSKGGKKTLYEVEYKRDDSVLEAFITFDYRVVHPKVMLRSILYAIVFITFGIVSGLTVFGVICFLLAAFCIWLVLFRKNISLSMTRKDDEDYKNGTVFTYRFTDTGARMLRNGKPEVYAKGYKKSMTAFFADQEFYYIATTSDDLFILPKNRFTIGDPDEFESFILQKTGLEKRWIPRGLKGILNSLKTFSQQPMIDTQGWKDIVNHQRGKIAERRNEASRKEQSEASSKVKPKSLKDKSKK